jgi:putative membrane protein
MKNLNVIFVFAVVAACFSCKSRPTDKVGVANAANEKKTGGKNPQEATAEFLVKITDGRLMDIREGEEAAKKGTSPAIREYGQLMLRDQKALLEKITLFASQRQVTLPSDIGSPKEDGFKKLDEKAGRDFDKKFIKMMKIDHQRDIRAFKKASKINDAELRQFISVNLPVIESHLAKLKAIEKSSK